MAEADGTVLNDVGDVVLSDPLTIGVLADPLRFKVFNHVQRNGPVDEAALGAALRLPREDIGAGLHSLSQVGLVTRSSAGWTAPGRGLYVDATAPGAEGAVRRLYEVMILDTTDLPPRWVQDQAGRLDDDWFRSSGMFNARISLTTSELDDIQVKLEEVLSPYTSRSAAPEGARKVRVLAYFMAEPD